MVMPLGNEASPRIIPWATYLVILLNLGVFLFEFWEPDSFLIAYSATPHELTHRADIHHPFIFQVEPSASTTEDIPTAANSFVIHQAPGPTPIELTLITALFLHASLFHLAGNMLFLFIFGQKIEEALGWGFYLIFYLSCGVIGTLAQVAASPASLTPILGASGAVAGIMGAYLVWFPRDRVRVLVVNVVYLIPASGVIGCWIAWQMLQGFYLNREAAEAGNIAYVAHIGGASAGIGGGIMIWQLRRGQGRSLGT